IMGHLRRNMRYRLDVEYPPRGRDFASYFVLDARQGYCSYFATAMAVMGRLAGLPTRYVEGYSAHPGEAGVVTLTGMNAHAWAEVYFKGLGWVAFDATNGGPGNTQDGANDENGEEEYGYDPGESDAEETPFEDNSDTLDGETEDENSDAPDENDTSDPPEKGKNGDDTSASNNENENEDDTGQDPDDELNDEPDESDDTSDEDKDESAAPEDDEAPPDTPDRQRRGVPWFLIVILIIALIALAVWWMVRRLESADPMALCRRCRRAQQAALIAYRANLTILSHMGQQPQTGETPDAFAQRIGREYRNPDYAEFVKAVLHNRYGGRPMKKESVEIGLRAYRRFLNGLSLIERLRFTITRIMRGLGDFENIP
ncbi:MAG: transglutaminase domain-containing protein, partial [bacterium]